MATLTTGFSDIVKQGYVKMKSKKLGVWQKKWIILRRASSKGGLRIEKYADERSAITGQLHKPLDLSDVKSCTRMFNDLKKHAVIFCYSDGLSRSFACDSDAEADSWLDALKHECFPVKSVVPEPDVYYDYSHYFHVYLLPCPNLALSGECLLQVTAESIELLDAASPTTQLAKWPLNALRRYGRDQDKFTFEAGRFCETGEGLFIFNTMEGDAIYQKVHTATLAIAEAHRILNLNKQQGNVRSPLTTSSSFPLTMDHPNIPVGHTRSLPFTPGVTPSPPPRPLPSLPNTLTTNSASSSQHSEDSKDEDDYIYEEKSLDPKFRRFLASRKEDTANNNTS